MDGGSARRAPSARDVGRAHAASRRGTWCVRITVWTAFALTVAFAGPRAWTVVSARYQVLRRSAPQGAVVDLDRVGFVAWPPWLRDELLTQVALDLAPVLAGGVGLLDEPACERLLASLRAVPWVAEANLRRIYPDRLRTELVLRRPVARLRAGDVELTLDENGVCLPSPPRLDLPVVDVLRPLPGNHGAVHQDPAVVAAAAVAAEWMTAIVPAVPGAPTLLRVDASNLGYAGDAGRTCEVRVALQRTDGGLAWLEYDHPPGSAAPRIDPETKAAVLRQLLAAHPGLAGIASADLRFARRWQAWVAFERPAHTPP